MPCYKPIDAWRPNVGKQLRFSYHPRHCMSLAPIQIPCGQCVGCRLERSRQWAVRCMHEASLHEQNCFITLTYDDAHLPASRSLIYSDFQLFMKRLRKRYGEGIRFYMCGEYGEKVGRPHFHACIFGHDFEDKGSGGATHRVGEPWKVTSSKSKLYRSPALEELWDKGFSTVGDVTFESAAYVARYIMKKVSGEAAESHYKFFEPSTGEIFDRRPEFTKMSLKPGIGAMWLEKYLTDVYPNDYVILRGRKVRPPKYYDRRYQIMSIEFEHEFLMMVIPAREAVAKLHLDDNTVERLRVKEQVSLAGLAKLKRNLL